MLIIDPFFLLYFFPVFICLYILVRKRITLANLLIIAASIYFYSTFGIHQLPVLLLPLALDYLLGILIYKVKGKRQKQILLSIGVIFNILLLGYFKYSIFFADNFSPIIIPVGLSFITFQRISYIVDIYRKKLKPERNIIGYTTYATLFPHIISGPIIRFSSIKKQLMNRTQNLNSIFEGTKIFTIGFGYKILIADHLNILESYYASNLSHLHTLESFLMILYFTFRIYFDFLGYSLMAVGLAKMIGFDFPFNFNAPYQSKSITEFWRRWNITLSSWIRDYLYIPLGGNRKGKYRTYFNLIITMTLAGLWHGANWNFVLWGLLQGVYLAVERLFAHSKMTFNVPGFFKGVYAFTLIMIGWIIFKFSSIAELKLVFKGLFDIGNFSLSHTSINMILYTAPALICAIFISFFLKEGYLEKIKPKLSHAFLLGFIFLVTLVFALLKNDLFFIYNQF